MTDKTYEIHIDESGAFGDWQAKQKQQVPDRRVIGGLVVPEVLRTQENELKEKLGAIQQKFFPAARTITGIHVSEVTDFSRQNELRAALEKILKEQMADARIIFIYDRTPAQELEHLPGAKFYRNMLFHLLQTVVFFHPQFEPEASFSLKLAHRRFSYASKFEDYLSGQGYLKLRSTTDGHTELTAVTAAELETSLDTIQKALRFSTQRSVSCTVKVYERWDSPFMVMADWICNTLLHLMKFNKSDSDLLKAAEKAFGSDRILFFCPSDFELPESLVTSFHQNRGDLFLAGFLQREKKTYIPDRLLLYPAYQKAMANLSQEPEKLTDEQSATLVGIADSFLQKRLYSRLPDVRQLLDILAGKLGKTTSALPDRQRDRLAWRYHDAGLRWANHTGNIAAGRLHYEQGKLLFDRLPDKSMEDVRNYHQFMNRAAIISANEFAFDRSCTFLGAVCQKEEQFTVLFGKEVQNEIYGKICGTLAQNYAFQRSRERANKFFLEARHHLGENEKKQASYRAHFAVDNKDRQAFRNEVVTVLDLTTFPSYQQCVETCLNNSRVDVFTLHLLVKGLIIFANETTPNEKKEIWKQISTGISSLKQYNYHPWQLFFTVAGRFLLQMNEKETARRMWWNASSTFRKDEKNITLTILAQQSRAWETLSWLNENNLKQARESFAPVARWFRDTFEGSTFPGVWNPNKIADSDGTTRTGWFDGIGERLVQEPETMDTGFLHKLCTDFIGRFTFNYW